MEIANDIAERNGMSLDYEPGEQNNPSYEHVEQSDASDLEFLKKLCDDAGLDLKNIHQDYHHHRRSGPGNPGAVDCILASRDGLFFGTDKR